MPKDEYMLVADEVRLTRREGEPLIDYLMRQAGFRTSSALRAREIMLVRGLQYRERARAALKDAEEALPGLEPEHRAWAEAQLRRLAKSLDWTA